MARFPQACEVLATRGPCERAATELFRNFAEPFGLLSNRCFRAVEFKKEHRRFRQTEIGMHIASPYLQGVQQLNAGHGYAGLNRLDGGVAAGFDRRKGTGTT